MGKILIFFIYFFSVYESPAVKTNHGGKQWLYQLIDYKSRNRGKG